MRILGPLFIFSNPIVIHRSFTSVTGVCEGRTQTMSTSLDSKLSHTASFHGRWLALHTSDVVNHSAADGYHALKIPRHIHLFLEASRGLFRQYTYRTSCNTTHTLGWPLTSH